MDGKKMNSNVDDAVNVVTLSTKKGKSAGVDISVEEIKKLIAASMPDGWVLIAGSVFIVPYEKMTRANLKGVP